MGPADSRTVSQGELLAQLWKYCRSIIQAADPHLRHMQVVFFDAFLSSTTCSMSFLDIAKLIQIVTVLRASSSFELFGLGCPGKEDAAASLAALAAWFFLNGRKVFPPPLAAHLLDPPLQGGRRPTPSPLTSSMTSVSADQRPTVLVTTVSKPDPVILTNPVTDEQGTGPFAPPTRKRRRRRHPRQTEAHFTPVVWEEPADSGLIARGAADPVLEHEPATTDNREAEILPRASPEAELEASVASGPLEIAEPAVTLFSSPPFMLDISPSLQLAAQLVSRSSSVPPSTSTALPPHPPPAAAMSPSSPPGDRLSVRGDPAPQPEVLSEPEEPAPPAGELSEPEEPAPELSEREELSMPEPELSEREELSMPEPELSEREELSMPEPELSEREELSMPEPELALPAEEELALPAEEELALPAEEELALPAEEELCEPEQPSEPPTEKPAPLLADLNEPEGPALPAEELSELGEPALPPEELGGPEGSAEPELEVCVPEGPPRPAARPPRPAARPPRPAARPVHRESWVVLRRELQRRRRHWTRGRPPEL
ncbi:uncharacterized protein KIAA0754-like [Haplochromis burtoni]|uniref:uncharacterized protein KIAA0754-like n=1 Tax=Haplochromis burtoni TaxID=8153 RepID=UPI001C2DC513|nr:uncharacterized protein KIAA0754-like [Haplochromis burtoni]